jgi:ATP-dependent protease HslVU (ClpYQ) peptidase subunit
MLIVMDKDAILVVSGTGEVIAPDDDLIAIGSGGNYASSGAMTSPVPLTTNIASLSITINIASN